MNSNLRFPSNINLNDLCIKDGTFIYRSYVIIRNYSPGLCNLDTISDISDI